MRVTVCELTSASPDALGRDWERLVAHARARASELVLLPEMPFHPWFGVSRTFDAGVWRTAVSAHDAWLERLTDLAPSIVLGTRPIERHGHRLNEAFCWTQESGYRVAHHKHWLPNEEGFWEACWYGRGDGSFDTQRCGAAVVGFQICTELWALDQSRQFGHDGVHLIATPRATPHSTRDKWLVGGRAAAVVSGAYSLSSNHIGTESDPIHLGGLGWIVAPDGDVLGLTSAAEPFVTREIDLTMAEAAKRTYPRYVF